jgi:hypothetical protein
MFCSEPAFLFAMDADETKFLPNRHSAEPAERKKTTEEPFAIGESTIFQMRNQDFGPAEEFGTVMQRPSLETQAAQIEVPIVESTTEDPLVRIEQKLDAALRQLHAMQQRLESLDATVARSLLR